MDKYSKRVYNYLLSVSKNIFYFFDPIPSGFDNEDEFRSALGYLVKLGYADYVTDQHGRHLGVYLNHEGMHKRELDIRAFWHSFFTRYLPGFISGILATLLSNLLINYVQQLLSVMHPQ